MRETRYGSPAQAPFAFAPVPSSHLDTCAVPWRRLLSSKWTFRVLLAAGNGWSVSESRERNPPMMVRPDRTEQSSLSGNSDVPAWRLICARSPLYSCPVPFATEVERQGVAYVAAQ